MFPNFGRDEDRKAEPDTTSLEDGAVTFDQAFRLQPLYPTEAR
jgi:hypothetical protein